MPSLQRFSRSIRRALLAATVPAALTLAAAPASAQAITVEDIGLETGFQDTFLGHFKKGRALVAADFNLDGRMDYYVGNPGDESYVAVNVPDPEGGFRFELVQVLVTGKFAWGASTADYDNDGDYDIYISVGGNEGIGFDYLFRNLWIESGGSLQFEDVTGTAGIAGPVPPGESEPIPVASANGVWGDYDLDGWIDLFVSVNVFPQSLPQLRGRNILWRNNGDGSFSDVTDASGLGATRRWTRNSAALDYDNDGDLDIYESNQEGDNVLWRNLRKETGGLTFEDVTVAMSLPGESLRYPFSAFASTVADIDHDGWQDLVVFKRGPQQEAGSPYPPGHAIFMNMAGTGFRNVAPGSGLNEGFAPLTGVMGCQIGDLNGDGVIDVYIGNGSPAAGERDDLFLSTSGFGQMPTFETATSLVDFPAPEAGGLQYPPYPYRTHGIVMADMDGDGLLELGVSNGGMLIQPAAVAEPNRLFRFDIDPRPRWLKVRPVGNGTTVSRDGIGSRIEVTVREGAQPRTHRGTLLGASAFSAQNGFEVFFGLEAASSVDSLKVLWPDGTSDTYTGLLSVDSSLVIFQDCGQASCVCTVTEAPETSCADGIDNDCDGFPDGADPDCAATAGDEFHMNAAGPAYAATFGVFFEADRAFQAGDFGFLDSRQGTVEFGIGGTADEDLYRSMRYGRGVVFWADEVEDGTYRVTLHFAEPFATAPGMRIVDVLAEGVVAINDLDLFVAAGGRRLAHSESFAVTVTDGRLEVEMRPVKGELVMLSAISVEPAE
jgi:hypothetical protein